MGDEVYSLFLFIFLFILCCPFFLGRIKSAQQQQQQHQQQQQEKSR